MAGRILTRALQYMQVTLRTDGEPHAPQRIDNASPIQPVYDVGPVAEREAARSAIGSSVNPNQPQRDGYIVMAASHTGAGTVYYQVQLTPTLLKSYGLDLNEFDLWWVKSLVQGTTVNSTWTSADHFVGMQGQPGSIYGNTPQLYLQTDGPLAVSTPSAVISIPSYNIDREIRVGPNWTFTSKVVLTSAFTVIVAHILRIAPK